MQTTIIQQIQASLETYSIPVKAESSQRFFKTGPGQYGEGDIFIGVSVPDQRKVAKQFFKQATFEDIIFFLTHEIHEYRLTALFLMEYKFAKAKDEKNKKEIVDLYLNNLDSVNNWDLVDSSAPKILGHYLFDKDRSLLYDLADSGHLWRQRVSVLATYYFIKNNDFTDTLKLSEKMLNHKHDLMHKAIGWMLREIGKKDQKTEENFLKKHYKKMPRTMLRYAIEKFDEEMRQAYLKGTIESE